MRPAILLSLCMLVIVSCKPTDPVPATPHARTIVETKGRTTLLDHANTPEVRPLAPERTVKGGPFAPVGDAGGGAIAHTRTYTTDDGLPMDDITCSYLAANGMLWFGTNGGGITRYDGHAFTNFTMAHGLPDNTILAIHGDSKGNIWIGTSTGGLCRYDGRSFTTMIVNDAKGLARGFTCMLEDTDGTLWFGTRGRGLYHYDGSTFTHRIVLDPAGNDMVRSLARTAGALWVATFDGLAHYDRRTFTQVKSPDGRKLHDMESMLAMPNGELWLGHVSGGLTRLLMEGAEPHLTFFPVLPDGPVQVNEMESDGAGGLWIASKAHGAIHFEPRTNAAPRVTRITAARGMASDELLCAIRDQRGDLWFGTRGAGLTHYRGEAFSYFRGFKPISIAEDPQGTVWVGTADGLARFDGNGFRQQVEGFGSSGWNYSVSIDPHGRVGFGKNMAEPGKHGISWFDGRDYHVTSVPDDRTWPDIFWTMHDGRGRLWAGGRRGTELYADGQRTSFTMMQGLGSDLVLFVGEDHDGAIWVGTDGGGVSRMNSNTVTTWSTEEGLPNNVVWTAVEEARGTMWITTLAGICRFDGRSFITYTTQDGLPDDNINQALLARDGNRLLVGTLNGLGVITGWRDESGTVLPFSALDGLPNDSVARYAPVIEVYNASTGFPVKDVQTAEHSLFEDSQGIVWIATGSDKTGLVRFDPKALRNDPAPIAVQLLSVSLNNEATCWYDMEGADADSTMMVQQEILALGGTLTIEERAKARKRFGGVSFTGIAQHFPIPQDLVLDYGNNRVGFSFVGVETARPEAVEYQWMLDGYDEHWSPPSRTSTASFGNIREGTYTFMLRARNASGVWCAPLEYRFEVLPPMHRTWWAYALYALSFSGLITFIIRRRTAVLHEQKEKLERTVAERTEELRYKKEEADEQRQRAELSEKAKEQFLANMSHEIRTPMNAIMGMSEILQERPHSPEQKKFLSAIHTSSENLLVIINDILDLTKIEAGRIDFEQVPFDVREVMGHVQDIMRFKADQKAIRVVVNVSDDVPAQLIGDPTRLNQIVMNLAGNAVKFTDHGAVTITARCEAVREAGEMKMVHLVIDVIDTGIGIPEDRLEKIFEEFTQAYSDTTRKYGGTGLGLTISKRLTELQGGRITVKSERGKGSTFTVRIPYPVVTMPSL